LGFRARASRISSVASGRGGPRYCGGQQSGFKKRLSSVVPYRAGQKLGVLAAAGASCFLCWLKKQETRRACYTAAVTACGAWGTGFRVRALTQRADGLAGGFVGASCCASRPHFRSPLPELSRNRGSARPRGPRIPPICSPGSSQLGIHVGGGSALGQISRISDWKWSWSRHELGQTGVCSAKPHFTLTAWAHVSPACCIHGGLKVTEVVTVR
jgi:hypothetical protein